MRYVDGEEILSGMRDTLHILHIAQIYEIQLQLDTAQDLDYGELRADTAYSWMHSDTDTDTAYERNTVDLGSAEKWLDKYNKIYRYRSIQGYSIQRGGRGDTKDVVRYRRDTGEIIEI